MQVKVGIPVAEVARKAGVAPSAIPEIREVNALRDERKRLIANLTLNKVMYQDLFSKKL